MELFLYNFVLVLLPLILLPLYFLIKFNQQNQHNIPPGPPRLPIIGNLHQIGKPPHRFLHKLSQKYGPIMLLQLGSIPTVVITSSEVAEQVLKTHDRDFCNRPSLAGPKRLTYNYLDIAYGPYSEYYKEMRKICVLELLSMKRVQSFAVIREEEVSVMIGSISNSTDPIDVFKMSINLLDKILSRVAFGKTFLNRDRISDGRFQEILNETMEALDCFSATDFFPSAGWIVDRITGVHGRIDKCFHSLDVFYQQIIDMHLNPERQKPEHEDLIDVMLKIEKEGTSTIRLTNDHIKAILADVFVGGIDPSAVTMSWAMTELMKNPEVMRKAQEEIRIYVGSKGRVQESDLHQFLYLKMVVKETLRLHTPGPLLIPRESTKHHVINGYDIFPKTRILINAWAIARNPDYWDKPDEFIPERFENLSLDYSGGQHFNFMPFGGGRRSCPGMNMALVSIELFLANLLYCFNWELPKGMNKDDINMEESSGLSAHKKYPLELVPTKCI